MSSGSSSNAARDGLSSIPAEARELVQRVKEIVERPEQEIYLALQECYMDPNDAVTRLLSQDSFHEVKSKKEKKKETKETPRNVIITSSRGGRGSTYRHDGRSGSTQFSSYDPGNLHRKPAYKKEHESVDLSTSSTLAYGMPDTTINRQRIPFSASGTAENKSLTTGTFNGISSSSQPSPGFQPAWVGSPGQVSMADIVKMGGRKALGTPNTLTDSSCHPLKTGAPAASNNNSNHPISSAPQEVYRGLETFHEPSFEVSVSIQEAGRPVRDHASHDEWNLHEQSSSRGDSVLEPPDTAEVLSDPSISSNSDRTKLHLDSWSDKVQESESEVPVEHTSSASASGREIHVDNSGGSTHCDNDSFKNVSSYPHQRQTSEHPEGDAGSSQLSIPNYSVSSVDDVSIAVSNAAVNLQQLSLQEERGVRSTEVKPTVPTPNHKQIPSTECSHLSFGSFGSVANASFPGSYASNSTKTDLEETSVSVNTTSSDHAETRAPEYFGDEHLESTSDRNAAPRGSAGAGSYGSSTQPEVMNQNAGEAIQGQEYNFPTSVPGYMLDNNLHLNAAFPYEQTNPQMHNLAHLSSVMEAYSNSMQGNPFAPTGQPVLQQDYSNSLQGNQLAPTGQPRRELSDLTYSSFLSTQSVPTKYNTTISSINGPSLSMPENVKPGMFSMPHPTAQTLPGTNISTGPALPQHLVHPYSQPALPLGHFANMIGYPFLPQNYAYLPSAYQQAYPGSSTYHQSPAAAAAAAAHNAGMKYTLPQYKSSVPASSVPQSASVASAYGGFGSSVNIPGGFTLNPSTTSGSTAIGYDDVMSSQYKESNHFLPIQQNDSSTVWVQGPGSRTVAALPASTYYSFQGQGQHHSGFRQAQQPPQHYGNLGYQNLYHSQAGASQEHQQQTQNDGTLNGSQGQPSKQSHQMWQHPY